jgi:hypothetical protein
MGNRFGLVALLGALVPASALGASFDLQTAAGNGYLSQGFYYDSRSGRDAGVDWNFGLNLAGSKSTLAEFEDVTDRTYGLSGGMVWKVNRTWDLGGILNLSTTPTQNLQSAGLTLYGEFRHYFGPEPEPDDELAALAFRPSFSVRLALGGTRLSNRPSERLRILFPNLADLVDDLNQRSATLEVGGSPWQWLSARVAVTRYSYNKDVNTFLTFLSNRRSLGASTFAASLNGLPDRSSSISFNFYPSDTWEIALSGRSATSITDGARSRGSQLSAAHDFNSWLRAGLGFERDVADSLNQTLALLNLSFGI